MTPPTRRSSRQSGTDGSTTAVSVDGRRVVYTEYGSSDGAPVCFLHGTPGTRLLANLFDATARERGVRLIAPDRPGYGRSAPWPERAVSDASEFVCAVLDDAGVRTADLVAFSGGCPSALATAARRPARVGRLDVVAGATPPSCTEEMPTTQRLLAGLASSVPFALGGLLRGQAGLVKLLGPSLVVDQYTTGNAESVPDDVADLLRADFLEAFAHHRSGAVTEFRHMVSDWEIEFGAVDTEVRLWHGENDANVPVGDARRFESVLPTATLHTLADADHLRTLLRAVPDVLEERGRTG